MTNSLNAKTLHIAGAFLACILSFCALAAPTPEQVRQIVEKNGIPQWQRAVAQAKGIRTSPPDTYAAETWKALDAETDTATGKAPLARVTTPRDVKDIQALTAWLRWRVLSENADGRYSYAYAANLHYMLDNNGKPLYPMESAVFFFHARLALAIDGARCIDKGSPQGVVFGYETQKYITPLIEKIDKMSKKERAVAMLEAVSLETVRGERPPFSALCTRGPRAMLKALDAGREPVEQPPAAPGAPQLLGKTYAIDTSGIEPELIPEEEWKAKRREILDQYVHRAAEML